MDMDTSKLLENATDVECTKCNNTTFEKITMLKRISALMSPTGQTEIIPVDGFRCTECKHILSPDDVLGITKETSTSTIIK